MVPPRQSVQRQPPSDRSVPGRRRGARSRRDAGGLSLRAGSARRRATLRVSHAGLESARGLAADRHALIALTSIHWREAWKYGERAFRYCQHDLGHAIAAIRIAAALAGLRARMLPDWSHADIASLTGIDRDDDFVDAEREEPGCLLEIGPMGSHQSSGSQSRRPSRRRPRGCLDRTRQPVERGPRAVDLHRRDCRGDARSRSSDSFPSPRPSPSRLRASRFHLRAGASVDKSAGKPAHPAYPAPLLLQRRSAVALDGRSPIDADRFFAMLSRVMPGDGAPWDAVWWSARIHLALFVHRVDGVEPGLYLLPRRAGSCSTPCALRCGASSCGSRRPTRYR